MTTPTLPELPAELQPGARRAALYTMREIVAAGALAYPGTDGAYHFARVTGPLYQLPDGRWAVPVSRGYYGPGLILDTDLPVPYRSPRP